MEQVTTITLHEHVGDTCWRWRSVAGQTGCCVIDAAGVRPGDQLVVGLRWRKASWQVTSYRHIPDHAWLPGDEVPETPAVTLGGSALRAVEDHDVRPGDVRRALAHMNPRSTSDADAGRNAKLRPAVVAWVDHDSGHAGVHFVYDVDSAVRRQGLGRRIRDWDRAGLRKPSVVAGAEHVVDIAGLGAPIGRLSATDLGTLGIEPRRR